MRRFALAVAAVLVILVASAIMATRAIAMSITAPTGLAPAIGETSATEQVYWRRHWRRRYWRGWGSPRHFWWGWRRFWSGFPFFAPRWYGYRHHRHHRHRPQKPSPQKQEEQQKPQPEPAPEPEKK
jgi:hypothetical protein